MKIHKIQQLTRSMRIYLEMYRGNDKRVKYTFRNYELNPIIKRQLQSIIKQCKKIDESDKTEKR